VARRFNQDAAWEIAATACRPSPAGRPPSTTAVRSTTGSASRCGHIPLSVGPTPDRERIARIDADLRAILAGHRPEPPPATLAAAVEDIQRRFEREHAPRPTGFEQACRSRGGAPAHGSAMAAGDAATLAG
jgi:hypothetical protein